ncbi:MAG: MBL fold metallo-hydrolase [Cephaloticoccus sp.]
MPKETALLEDEVGDVLEKAIRQRGITVADLGTITGVSRQRIQDALDYRSELSCAELRRLAGALQLNEVGLCALGCGCYPRADIPRLPFEVHVVAMVHGIGCANAYVVTSAGPPDGVLFDTGPSLGALLESWPASVAKVEAVFLTHLEGEHTGGLCDVVDYFGIATARVPAAAKAPCGQPMGEGDTWTWSGLKVTALRTPGHAAAHNCYLVQSVAGGPALLVSGDLLFAGSAGGAFYDQKLQQTHLRRILDLCPEDTVVAPGHGPMTTVRIERRYNPFLA